MEIKELIKALSASLIGDRLNVLHIKNLIERLQELEELKRENKKLQNLHFENLDRYLEREGAFQLGR